MTRETDARRNAFEAMMEKQQQQLKREQQEEEEYKRIKKIGANRGNNRGRLVDDDDTSSSDIRVPTSYQSKETGGSSLTNLCNNQAEEIRMLYEQLNQREVDLKEMRYEYIAAIKETKIQNADNFKNAGKSSDAYNKMNRSSNETQIGNDVDNDDDDDDDYVTSRHGAPATTNVPTSPPRRVEVSRNDRLGNSDIGHSNKSKKQPKSNGTATDKRLPLSSSLIRGNSRRIENKEREITDNNTGEEFQNTQLLDLIDFRNKATTEYEKLRKSYETLKVESDEKKSAIEETCNRLIRFVSAIESSTQHGRHTCGSRTVMGLLMKTRQGLEGIRDSVYAHTQRLPTQTDPRASTQNIENDKDLIRLRMKFALGSAPQTPSSGSNESLENMLLEMCKHLEHENSKLEGVNEELREEIKSGQSTTVNDLIPHYRLAIVRSRNEMAQVLDELKSEKKVSKSLRKQLEAAFGDMQKKVQDIEYSPREDYKNEMRNSKNLKKQNYNSGRNEFEENSKIKNYHENNVINNDIAANYGLSVEYNNSGRNKLTDSTGSSRASSTNLSASTIVSKKLNGQKVRVSSNMVINEEYAETQLQALDEEIGALKSLLEEAALKHTQRIIAEVIDTTLSA